VSTFTWNSPNDTVPIIPVVHGTGVEIAKQICSSGFAALSSLDAGFYGKGIYFTSSCCYATPYFGSRKEPAILICFIIPGNIRPIVEWRSEEKNYLGAIIDNGYQSHYVLTDLEGNPLRKKKERYYDEFVLAIDPQVVPIFLICVNRSIIPNLIKEFQRETPEKEQIKSQSFTDQFDEELLQIGRGPTSPSLLAEELPQKRRVPPSSSEDKSPNPPHVGRVPLSPSEDKSLISPEDPQQREMSYVLIN